ncbi:methyltransferase domain-containing protein [Paraflavitalea sp. CAU 1676]|uniref:methyltransferase domain-containing protein n=1 Tax=Paraflavitalea sp. CAU 1676 TaxID=3032598 RepID=UPI0023DAAFCE|nr:methyltransferase domain-containing protein [Paraflavitalea sp. CAU 1676]
MPWDPDKYNRFINQRSAPFFDAMALVHEKPALQAIDLGCGTGELTSHLADKHPDGSFLGIDSSPEMLRDADKYVKKNLRFEQRSIEQELALPETYDLVFSNAALQWVPDHEHLFAKLIKKVKPGGQLIAQMPAQHHNIANRLLLHLATESPFKEGMKDFKRDSPVMSLDKYATLLFTHGGTDLTVIEKIYPLEFKNVEEVYHFVGATGMIPYIEALPEALTESFINVYKQRLAEHFNSHPVFYPFRRILLSATF